MYEDMVSALDSAKISTARGDCLRATYYCATDQNPWSKGEIQVGDYASNFPASMSVSAETNCAKTIIEDHGGSDEPMDIFIIYKIEGAERAAPLLPKALSLANAEECESLYAPKNFFKVKGITQSKTVSKGSGEENPIFYKRIGVILEEVDNID